MKKSRRRQWIKKLGWSGVGFMTDHFSDAGFCGCNGKTNRARGTVLFVVLVAVEPLKVLVEIPRSGSGKMMYPRTLLFCRLDKSCWFNCCYC